MLVSIFANLVRQKDRWCLRWVDVRCGSRPVSASVFDKRVTLELSSGEETVWNSAQLIRELQRTAPLKSVPVLFSLLSVYDGPTFNSHLFLTERAERLARRSFGLLLFRCQEGRLVTNIPRYKQKIQPRNGLTVTPSKPPELWLLPTKKLKSSLLKRVRETAL